MNTRPGTDAVRALGWLRAHRWLLLRRASQLGILALFLAGPLAGVWIVKGTLASSLILDVLPLTDPLLALQSVLAGHFPETAAIVGALLVTAFYLAVGGRVYCSWVCPINVVTDAAAWLRERLGLRASAQTPRNARYWILGAALGLSALTGTLVWELVNPVSILFRGLVFGMGMAWFVVAAVFLYDLLLARRGWCGHLCPVGAFYSLLGRASLLRIAAPQREQCNDCMDCFAVCPEPQVIRPALKGKGPALIDQSACTNCGRCIDVCSKQVFRFGSRFGHGRIGSTVNQREVTP